MVVSISLYGGRCIVSAKETWMGMVSMVLWLVFAIHNAIDVPLLVKYNSSFVKMMVHCVSPRNQVPELLPLPIPQPQLHTWQMSPQQ